MKMDQKTLNRTVLSSLIGATIEWYDFFLFGVMAGVVLNKLYFPSTDPTISLMLAYATFAVGFISRPLGGIVFGHFGDKVGRKSVLVITLMIMGISTFLVGCIPTYDQIGLWAPALLLTLRVLQGIGLGGEWGGAVLMAYESAPEEKRGFYTSIPQMGLSIGILLASGSLALLSALMSDEAFMAWGWRICFLASFMLVLVGMWIRTRLFETPEFAAVKESHKEAKLPIVEMFKKDSGKVLLGLGARHVDGVFFNVFSVFSVSYLISTIGISRNDALIAVMVGGAVLAGAGAVLWATAPASSEGPRARLALPRPRHVRDHQVERRGSDPVGQPEAGRQPHRRRRQHRRGNLRHVAELAGRHQVEQALCARVRERVHVTEEVQRLAPRSQPARAPVRAKVAVRRRCRRRMPRAVRKASRGAAG